MYCLGAVHIGRPQIFPYFDPYPPHICNRLHFKYPSLKRTSTNWEFDPPPSTFIYDTKKLSFSKSPILKKKLRKFQRLVFGLVGLIDAVGINLVQPIWLRQCGISAKTAQKHQKCIFYLFLRLYKLSHINALHIN